VRSSCVGLASRGSLTWICRNIGVLQTTVAELITDERHQREFGLITDG